MHFYDGAHGPLCISKETALATVPTLSLGVSLAVGPRSIFQVSRQAPGSMLTTDNSYLPISKQPLGVFEGLPPRRCTMRAAPSSIYLIILATISVGVVRTDAHQAKTGWTYPLACCKAHEAGGDCAAIPAPDILRGARGFSVFLHAGDHHMARRPHVFFIPYGDEIPSGDGQYHICLHPTEDDVNCFFAPPDSS